MFLSEHFDNINVILTSQEERLPHSFEENLSRTWSKVLKASVYIHRYWC